MKKFIDEILEDIVLEDTDVELNQKIELVYLTSLHDNYLVVKDKLLKEFENDINAELLVNFKWFYDYLEGKISIGKLRELIAQSIIAKLKERL